MEFKCKVTEVKPHSGTNQYGEHYQGYNVTVVEVDTESTYRNAAVFYMSDNGNPPHVGDIGTIEIRSDIRTGNEGRTFTTARACNYKCTEVAPL